MSRMRSVFMMFLGCVAALGLAASAEGQIGSTLRGKVFDTDGSPIPDVNVEFRFKGETRVPIVRKAKTDKKGQYVRVGLQSGEWEVIFTKEGFKPKSMNTSLSGDVLNEAPPLTLEKAAAGSKPITSAAQAEAHAKEQERLKELGATYKEALDAMLAGDHAKAEAGFKTVLDASPGAALVHHNLGYVYMLQNKGDEAEASFRKALELDPNNPDSYSALATLLAAKGQVNEAYDLMNGVALLFGEDAKFQFALGVAASNSAKDEAALAAFTKVQELDPANVESLFYLGTLATSRNESATAIDFLKRYVAGAPADAVNLETAKVLLDALVKATSGKKK